MALVNNRHLYDAMFLVGSNTHFSVVKEATVSITCFNSPISYVKNRFSKSKI